MKKMVILLVAVIGCQFSWAQKVTTYEAATAVTVEELNSGIRMHPFICEYEMIPKNNPTAVYEEYNTGVLVTSIVNNIDTWIDFYVKIVKSKMMKKHGADAIFSPTEDISTGTKGELIITLRGYPIKYTNFRLATEEDSWMWHFNSSTSTMVEKGGQSATIKN